MTWRARRDPLYRGDSREGVALPVPDAAVGIVEHILYLGGPGRESPFQSTTESRACADHFADGGRVYETSAPRATAAGVGHTSLVELKGLLKQKGKGRAKWSSALEVAQARRYVEQWSEHLLDYTGVPSADVAKTVAEVYK